MTLSLALLLALAGLIMFLLVLVYIGRGSRGLRSGLGTRQVEASSELSPDPSERQASATSEAIEKLVNDALVKAGLGGTQVDFGTAHDGSLEIWIGDQRYTSVEALPDPRIRQAVADAVAAFNR
jgi:hypothetical protein